MWIWFLWTSIVKHGKNDEVLLIIKWFSYFVLYSHWTQFTCIYNKAKIAALVAWRPCLLQPCYCTVIFKLNPNKINRRYENEQMASFNTVFEYLYVGSDSHGCSSWIQTCQHCEADETGAGRQGAGPYKLCQQVYRKQSKNRSFENNLYCKLKWNYVL